MLNEEQLQSNYDSVISHINKHISEPRKEKILNFFTKNEERLILCPASTNKSFHGAFPGGLMNHIDIVAEIVEMTYDFWEKLGMNMDFTLEEAMFSAIMYDMGKIGDETNDYYLKETSDWHIKKMGRHYKINSDISFMKVPDRTIYLLNREGIPYSMNEFYGIKLAYGLYDKTNESYLMGRYPDTEVKNNIHLLIHHSDILAMKKEQHNEQTFLGNESTIKEPSTPKKNVGGRPKKIDELKGFDDTGSENKKSAKKEGFSEEIFDDLFS